MGKTAKAKAQRYGEPTPAEEQPLLDEIIAAPDDDAPRLILADWLEERGDPRSEFIRVQCRLARLNGDEPEYDALEDREAELLAAHGARWLKRQPALPGIAYGVVRYLRDYSFCEYDSDRSHFVRGMVEIATPKTLRDVRSQGQALAERTVVREVRLANLTSRQFSQFLQSEFSARLRGLMLSSSDLEPEGAVALANSPLAANLETLTLSEALIGDGALKTLLPKLKRVKRLCFTGDALLEGVGTLAGWKGLKNVQALYFDLDDDSFAKRLAASPYLTGLRTLRPGSFLSDRAVKMLADSKGLRRLRALCLFHATITRQAAARLAGLTELRRLSLCYAEMGDPAARALADLSRLRRLDLRKTNVTRKGVDFLKKSLPACKILSDFSRK